MLGWRMPMRRITGLLLLIIVLSFSACNSSLYESIIYEEEIGIYEVDGRFSFGNLVPELTHEEIAEGIRRLAVVDEEDINWSGESETRTININDHITKDEFLEIKELVLANGYTALHGTRHGVLPSYYFESIQVFLIPSGWWNISNRKTGPENFVGLNFTVGWFNDPLQIHSYTVYHDSDHLGNTTDTLGNLTLVTYSTNTGITDGQILAQFLSYLNEVRRVMSN